MGHAVRRRRGPPAADPHVAGPDPRDADDDAADPGAPAGPLLPLRGDRRLARLGVLPGRRADGRRGHDHGATSRACSTSSPRRCTAPTSGRASGPATTRSPSRRSRSTSSASSAAAPGCPACGRTGWMTILGAGMVHPVVLQYGGLDPERYQGFAFGMGPERIKMLKHGITRPAAVPRERPPLPGAVPMRVPLRWLREFVDVDLTPERLAERLTLLGMEVKGIERWGADWRNVVVGELLSVETPPARRPAVADPGDGRRRRAARDRLRRDEHRGRPARPGRAARRGPARRPADRADREDGRRQQRHALLGRRARA